MQIEEGKFYERENGEVRGPMKPAGGLVLCWTDGNMFYAKYGHVSPGNNHSCDLKREHIPNPQSAPGYSVIFGGAKVGCEPVPVVAKGEMVLWEGEAGNCKVMRQYGRELEYLLPIERTLTRVRIIEVPE